MPAPAAGVEHGELLERPGPALERPRRRGAVVLPAEVIEPDGALALGDARPPGQSRDPVPGAPPRPDGVVEQELHHVMLGEKLGDGGERPPVDLLAALVDLVLLLALPELVDPPERVVGGEDRDGQARQQLLQREPVVDRELDLQQHVVGAEDFGKHPAGIFRRQDEAVRCPLRPRQFLALREGDRHAVRVHQEVVLREEAGEEHPVPVFVSEFLGQPVDLLRLPRLVPPVARLPPTGAEPLAERLVRRREVLEWLGGVDRPPLQRRACHRFRQVACLDDHVFQLPAEVGSQRRHQSAFSLSWADHHQFHDERFEDYPLHPAVAKWRRSRQFFQALIQESIQLVERYGDPHDGPTTS